MESPILSILQLLKEHIVGANQKAFLSSSIKSKLQSICITQFKEYYYPYKSVIIDQNKNIPAYLILSIPDHSPWVKIHQNKAVVIIFSNETTQINLLLTPNSESIWCVY